MKIKDLLISKKSKILFSVLAILVVIAVIIVAVSAKYVKQSNKLVNTFNLAATEKPEITEEFDKQVKKDVKIEVGETGYPVYVRVKLVFNWQEKGDENGAFYFDPPKAEDYSLIIGEKWMYNEDDGFYYYLEPVPSEGVTEVLIKECKPVVTPPDGYELSVNIITQTVQAVGHTDEKTDAEGKDIPTITAVEDAWGVDLGQ